MKKIFFCLTCLCVAAFSNMHISSHYQDIDYAKSAKIYENACKNGGGNGCNNAGVLYENDRGVKKDIPQAAEFYQKACGFGSSNGCRSLLGLYNNDKISKQNFLNIKENYQGKCKENYENACKGYRILDQLDF